MVTATVNDEVILPDELPETSSSWVGQIVQMGFQAPPEKKAAAIRASGGTVRSELYIAIQPLSFRYVSDRALFPNDYEERSVPVYNKNGDIQGKGSQLDDYKEAFRGLGYNLRSNADCSEIVGKKFRFQTKEKKMDLDGIKNPWLTIPLEPAEDYIPPSPVPERRRPMKKDQPVSLAAARAATDDSAANAILTKVMEGASESEYMSRILASAKVVGADDSKVIISEPFLGEALNKTKMTERLVAAGMRVDNGKVVA